MNYKQKFIQFLAECGVLKFGTFTLKSGRVAPYFLNAGEYKTGAQIRRLLLGLFLCFAIDGFIFSFAVYHADINLHGDAAVGAAGI